MRGAIAGRALCAVVLMLSASLGCGNDDDATAGAPSIASVGDENGDGVAYIGEDLVVRGGSLSTARFTIGGRNASVLEQSADTARVRVPARTASGNVDLVAETGGGAALVEIAVRRIALTADSADQTVSVLGVGLDGSVSLLGAISVPVQPGPFAIAFSPDGRLAVIACGVGFLPDAIIDLLAPGAPPGGSVAILDVIAGRVTAVIEVGEASKPTGVAVHPDGRTAYVTNYANSTVSVIDLESMSLVENIAVPRQPEEIEVRPDGTAVLVNSVGGTVSTIDPASLEILDTLVTGGNDPSGVYWSEDGDTGYVTHSFTDPSFEDDGTLAILDTSDPTNLSVLDTITDNVGPTPFGLDVAAGGEVAVVTNLNVIFEPLSIGPGSVSIVDLNDPTDVVALPVGNGPIRSGLTPDGRFALVGNGLDQTVSVIDLETKTVVDTIMLASSIGPSDVVVQP